jgi:hypothetical protein
MKRNLLAAPYLLAASLLWISANANATVWEEYASAAGGQVLVYVATDRISKHGDLIDVWNKFVYRTPQTDDGITYNYTVTQESVSCPSRTFHTNTITAYRSDGSSLKTEPGMPGWQQAVPDSITDVVMSKLCAAQSPKH